MKQYAVSDSDVDAFIESIAPASLRDGSRLRAVAAAHARSISAEQELADAVSVARAAGDSWTMIGAMLGTSKQNAHRKFGTTRASR